MNKIYRGTGYWERYRLLRKAYPKQAWFVHLLWAHTHRDNLNWADFKYMQEVYPITCALVPYVSAWKLPLNPENLDEIVFTVLEVYHGEKPQYPEGVDENSG